jgi:hypothetical protein
VVARGSVTALPGRSPVAALPALLLVVLSLWEVCAAHHDAGAVPDDEAWQTAAKVVRDGYQRGDLIVFAPGWADPIGRMVLGDLIPVETAARMDAARYGRIWELAIRGAAAPETAGLAPVMEKTVGGVTVRRFERTPVTVLADLRELLATVKGEGGMGTLELAEVGFEPHRCIQVVPAPGRPVKLTFPAVPLGTSLVGYVGLADIFTRREIREPGKLDVAIAGKHVASASAGIDDGWVRFEAVTQPGTADIEVTVSADAKQRLVCFAAETRR